MIESCEVSVSSEAPLWDNPHEVLPFLLEKVCASARFYKENPIFAAINI